MKTVRQSFKARTLQVLTADSVTHACPLEDPVRLNPREFPQCVGNVSKSSLIFGLDEVEPNGGCVTAAELRTEKNWVGFTALIGITAKAE